MPADPRTALAQWCREERAKLDAATARPWQCDLRISTRITAPISGTEFHRTIVKAEDGPNVYADAALIVSAVNAHAALVAFVELELGYRCQNCDSYNVSCTCCYKLRDRLVKLARDLGLMEEGK